MLDTDTKRRIDSARDILVGKVPDPKSQVDQITIALIYKFMDDMDAESEVLGGKRKFFAGEWARYGWPKLMRSGLGGHEVLNLYGEAIARMPENPGIPVLFRDIFKNVFLPYRDPETLKSFLKIIDEFEYDHSERLGDAFEHLLSVLGSQGDAGQFRTPRHIIDFMVKVIGPKKNETMLDPACGTAGFLISAYKHILRNNKDKKGNNTLTPDEKGRLANNFKGYDISPDMVRLSLVNLYLHGFIDPRIDEYDTLTSDDKWNEYADVILANPPFMSPKGGIKPHKRFSIQAKRSEVLFVDYMAEHLTPKGRAAIIVPEGIIFNSQTAYKKLRKMLVDEYLVAVVSLPAGCFNPYSGVKTSILILDKSLARQSNTVAFFKVANDGFDLGAQRRTIQKNDLPQVQTELAAYFHTLRTKAPTDELVITTGLIVPKENIATNGDYNLSSEGYREGDHRLSEYPHVELGEVVDILDSLRRPITKSDRKPGPYPYYGATGVLDYVEDFLFDEPLVLVGEDGAKWGAGESSAFLVDGKIWVNNHAHVLRPNRNRLMDRFLIEILNEADLIPFITGVTVPKLNQSKLRSIKIPLPPLEIQKEIVAEIEGYQKVIDGARAVLDNYRPHIPIHPDWPMVELGDIFDITSSKRVFQSEWKQKGVPFYRAREIVTLAKQGFVDNELFISAEMFTEYSSNYGVPQEDDLMVTGVGTLGVCYVVQKSDKFYFKDGNIIWLKKKTKNETSFIKYLFQSDIVRRQIDSTSGATVGTFTIINAKNTLIPLPPLATQQAIVAEIEAEQALVTANRELIKRMEQKIQTTLARIWGEEVETAEPVILP